MPFTLSFDASSPAGLADLNIFLESRSYVVGFAPTQTDVALFNAIGKAPNAATYPNVARFYNHIASFSDSVRASWGAGVASSAAAVAASAGGGGGGGGGGKKAAADDSDSDSDDMFADSDDEGAAAKKKAKAKAAAAKAKAAADAKSKAKKKTKAPVIAKTQCVYEIKTLEAGQDMAALEAAIRRITIEGLTWGEQFAVVDVAYGIQKLVAQCVIVDDLVELQDIEDKMMELEDQVQSVDLATMNRL